MFPRECFRYHMQLLNYMDNPGSHRNLPKLEGTRKKISGAVGSAFSRVWMALRSERVLNILCASPTASPGLSQCSRSGCSSLCVEGGGPCWRVGERSLLVAVSSVGRELWPWPDGLEEPLNLYYPCQELWCLSSQTQPGPAHGVDAGTAFLDVC